MILESRNRPGRLSLASLEKSQWASFEVGGLKNELPASHHKKHNKQQNVIYDSFSDELKLER